MINISADIAKRLSRNLTLFKIPKGNAALESGTEFKNAVNN